MHTSSTSEHSFRALVAIMTAKCKASRKMTTRWNAPARAKGVGRSTGQGEFYSKEPCLAAASILADPSHDCPRAAVGTLPCRDRLALIARI